MNNISAAIDNLKSLEDALISTNLLRGFGTTISFLFDFLELYEQSISNGIGLPTKKLPLKNHTSAPHHLSLRDPQFWRWGIERAHQGGR